MWGNDDTGRRVRAGADDDDSRRFQWIRHFLGTRQATLRRQPLHLAQGPSALEEALYVVHACAGGGCQAAGAAGRVVKVAPFPKLSSATEAKPCSPNKRPPQTSCLSSSARRFERKGRIIPSTAGHKQIKTGDTRQILLALLGRRGCFVMAPWKCAS